MMGRGDGSLAGLRAGRRIWGLAPLLAAVCLFPPGAEAATATSVVMFSDSGDYIGGGEPRLFHPGNARIMVSGTADYVGVDVSGGTSGDSYFMSFAAPPGERLVPGVYDRAQRASFREAGRPGIDIGGDGRGCNTIEGRFEVKDFALNADGSVERLWIVYEQHCEGAVAALFGEVRIDVPVPDGPAVAAPAFVRWPVNDLGRAGTAVPVTVLARDAVQVSSASVIGDNPADFPVRLDECSGKALGAGGTCQVWMRFAPTAPGTRTAVLRIAEPGGRHYDVALQGFVYGGTTRVVMDSEAGDYIGQGQPWSYTPANAVIAAGGSRRYVGFWVDGADGSWWYADFAAPEGDILVPGRYPDAHRYPFHGSGPGLDVGGNGRGCNRLSGEFTITEASFEPDGRLRTFGVTFEQHCEEQTPALRGTFEFRAGDTTPPAPWMVSGPRDPGSGGDPGEPSSGDPGGDPGDPSSGDPGDPSSGDPGGDPGEPSSGGSGGDPGEPSSGDPGESSSGSSGAGSGTAPTASGGSSGVGAGTVSTGATPPSDAGGGGSPPRAVGPCARWLFAWLRVLPGTAGAETLRGRRAGDVILAGAGDDRILAGAGNDCVEGGPGADTVSGGTGADVLAGQGGNDVLIGGSGRDLLDCGPGRDVAQVTRGDRVRGCEWVVRARRRAAAR